MVGPIVERGIVAGTHISPLNAKITHDVMAPVGNVVAKIGTTVLSSLIGAILHVILSVIGLVAALLLMSGVISQLYSLLGAIDSKVSSGMFSEKNIK